MSTNSIFPFVVADIGGTNARFLIINSIDPVTRELDTQDYRIFASQNFSSLQEVVAEYFSSISLIEVNSACIAIAGPVIDDSVNVTNLDFDFSIEAIRDQLGIKDVHFINDFGTQAYATLYMQESDFDVIWQGTSRPEASRLVLGPGSGLGVASLVKFGGRWYPNCGEGGHVSFSACNDEEFELRKIMAANGTSHISVENLVSGPGLLNIYKALCEIRGLTPKFFTPEEVSEFADGAGSDIGSDAVRLFCKILGGAAGDLALAMGAFGGVYLGGGILPKLKSVLASSQFLSSFHDKGAMRDLMETLPVYLVTTENPALAGAAHWMIDMHNHGC